MRKFVLFLTLMLAGSAWAQTLRPADLTEGGYILYFRHGRADLGRDCKDSNRGEWWKSNDPTLTRQLEEEGKRQAKIIGQAFRRLDIPVGAVLSSEFKRALETARLMGLKEVVPERALTPLTAYGEFAPRLESLLLTEPEAGTNTVLVAHGHVLPMFEELTEGSAVVFRPGRTEPVGVIAYEDWEPVAGNLLFDSQNPDDRYILEDSVLTVRSHRGIGTVTLTPLSDSWPSLGSRPN